MREITAKMRRVEQASNLPHTVDRRSIARLVEHLVSRGVVDSITTMLPDGENIESSHRLVIVSLVGIEPARRSAMIAAHIEYLHTEARTRKVQEIRQAQAQLADKM